MMHRILPILVLLLALPSGLPLHAKEAPPDWKAQVRSGVEAWDADRAEEAEKVLTAAVAAAEKAKDSSRDPDLALAHQILSHLCGMRGETKTKKRNVKKGKTETDRHFQRAKDILEKAWTSGAGERSLQPFLERVEQLSARHRYAEMVSLQHLILEVLEVRAPGSLGFGAACCKYASALQYLGHFSEAEAQHRRALALFEKLRRPDGITVSRANLGECYFMWGRYREALDLYKRTLQEMESQGNPPRELGMTLSRLARAATRLGDEAQAEAMCQRALPIIEKLAQQETEAEKADPSLQNKLGHDEKRYLLTLLLTTWGDLRRGQGRFEEAEAFYGRAAFTVPVIETGISMAVLRQVQGRLKEAEDLGRANVKHDEQGVGTHHFQTASARTRLASICLAEGKDMEAEELLRKSLKVQEEVLGPQHPDTAETADILGTLLYARGAYEEAETLFESALEGRIEAFGEAHALVSETLGHQGDLYMTLGRPKDAEAPYRKALALDEKRLGAEHPGVGVRCRQLGQCLLTLARAQAAEPFLSRALRIDEATYGAEHPALDQDLGALSKLFKAKGDSGKQAEMDQRLEAGRAKAAEEPLKPAEPLVEVPATPEGLQGALRRGLGYLAEARGAAALDFDTKRRAYTDAEMAFAQAMKALETMKAAGSAPADLDEQAAQIRSFLFECHKCKPLPAGK